MDASGKWIQEIWVLCNMDRRIAMVCCALTNSFFIEVFLEYITETDACFEGCLRLRK